MGLFLLHLPDSRGAIWSLGLFGYYGASMASGFLFASGGAMDYTEVLFTSSGEIVGTTVVLLASWRLSAATLQPWCYLVSGLGCAGVLVAKLASTPPALIAILAFVVRAGSMGGVAVTCLVCPCASLGLCLCSKKFIRSQSVMLLLRWVLTPAAFPTHVRSTAHSVLYAWGSAGSLLAAWRQQLKIVGQFWGTLLAACCSQHLATLRPHSGQLERPSQ